MKNIVLFPYRFKILGWVLFLLGLLLAVVMRVFDIDSDYFGRIPFFGISNKGHSIEEWRFFEVVENGFLDEFASVLIIIGGILVGFCKTKEEDEYIQQLRLSSLVWAVYVNYAILLLAVLFVFDMPFFEVMVWNMFTTLMFFIIRFHIALYQSKRL